MACHGMKSLQSQKNERFFHYPMNSLSYESAYLEEDELMPQKSCSKGMP